MQVQFIAAEAATRESDPAPVPTEDDQGSTKVSDTANDGQLAPELGNARGR